MVTKITSTKKRPVYKKSEDLQNAESDLKLWENNRPGEYESKYEISINNLLNNIMNREDFKYNLNSDPLYQQYKELYVGNGKKAMEDTIGVASALTGGYSNSYAVTAGQQAYSDYLNQLNGVALGLHDRAYEKYQDEGDKLVEDINILRELDGDEYEKYLNELERYYQDGSYLLDKIGSMSDKEYDEFLQSVEEWESDRDFNYQKEQDALDRDEFEKELAYKKKKAESELAYKKAKDEKELAFKREEAKREQANKDREFKLKQETANKKSKSSSSGSSKSTGKKSSNTTSRYPTSYGEFCLRTGFSGILTNTEYNNSKQAKAKYDDYQDYLKAMYKKYS